MKQIKDFLNKKNNLFRKNQKVMTISLALSLVVIVAFSVGSNGNTKKSTAKHDSKVARVVKKTDKSQVKPKASKKSSSSSSSAPSSSSSQPGASQESPAPDQSQQEATPAPDQNQQEAAPAPEDPAQQAPSQDQIQGAQDQYGYTPGYGWYYPSDEEIAAEQGRQQWHDDQEEWARENDYE